MMLQDWPDEFGAQARVGLTMVDGAIIGAPRLRHGRDDVPYPAYAQRLGIWRGTDFPFASRSEFVAAVEVLARDLNALALGSPDTMMKPRKSNVAFREAARLTAMAVRRGIAGDPHTRLKTGWYLPKLRSPAAKSCSGKRAATSAWGDLLSVQREEER